MAKIFAAVYPNSECDKRTKWAGETAKLLHDYEFNCKIEPEGRDANYYEICFGEDDITAKATLDFIKSDSSGMMSLFSNDRLMMSVYGLYKAEILPDSITLEEFMNMETA